MTAFEEMPDVLRSVHSLVKNNNGLFRSAKQGAFLTKTFERDYGYLLPAYAGIEEEGKFASWTGWMRWADYGRRSTRQFGWIFKYDEFGIVKMWKLKWKEVFSYDNSMNYRSTGQMVLDPKGIKAIFERPADADLSILKAEMEKASEVSPVDASSEYVGNIGDKFEGEVEVTNVFVSNAGYYGPSMIIGMKDEAGNKLVWFSSSMPDVERGDKMHIKGTIKKHEEYRGVRQTALTRCKVRLLNEEAA
jgi:hypothetical protein